MKKYCVIVTITSEAISLTADNLDEAIKKAREVIAEDYGYAVAEDSTYTAEEC